MIARVPASARVTYTITSGADEPRQTYEEQAEIMRKLTILELGEMRAEGGQS